MKTFIIICYLFIFFMVSSISKAEEFDINIKKDENHYFNKDKNIEIIIVCIKNTQYAIVRPMIVSRQTSYQMSMLMSAPNNKPIYCK